MVVVATTKVHIFKQITTYKRPNRPYGMLLLLPQRYIFSSKSQQGEQLEDKDVVVVATTKVHIFKQITTKIKKWKKNSKLLLLPQRYIFSSKSQLKNLYIAFIIGCCCYHKGTYFQANHNNVTYAQKELELLLLPQRYIFSSKSQRRGYSNILG